MKQKILSVFLILCLSVSLFAAMGLSVDADAPAVDKAIMLGMGEINGYNAADLYDYLYFGSYEGNDVKWCVLDNKTNTGESGYFLLSENILGTTVFRTEANSFQYQGSSAQAWCTAFAQSAFSDAEQALLMATTKTDAASTGAFSKFDYTENILNGDQVFFLSAEEIQNGAYGIQATRVSSMSAWWGRSPGRQNFGSTGYEACTYNSLYNWITASKVTSNYGARPALNLNADKVLFTSAAVGGKNAKFGAVADYTGNEWKLTLHDSSRSFAVTETAITGAGGRYTTEFQYTGAATGTNEYISAMLVDTDETILYYGNLCKSQGSGKTRVLIPEALPDGNYTLRIFSEQCNGDYQTDYASSYDSVALTVDSSAHLSTHDEASFTDVLTVNDTAPDSGCYYLTGDITLSSLSIRNDVTVTICLNGHTLATSGVNIASGGTLTLCDCSGGGGLLTGSTTTQLIVNQGKLTLREGVLRGSWRDFAIYNYNATLSVLGGSILNQGAGPCIHNDQGSKVYLSGSPVLSADESAAVYIKKGTDVFAQDLNSNCYEGGEITVSTNITILNSILIQKVTDTNASSFRLQGDKGYHLARSGENLVFQYTHEHTWSPAWTGDNTAHWHECLESQCTVSANQDKDGYAEHNFGTRIEQTDATCMNTGTAAHYICSGCQTYFTAEQTATVPDDLILPIDPNAHSYGAPDYVWAEDNRTCTATRICAHNNEHREVEISQVGSQITQVQSCEEEELTRFAATFVNSAFTTQVKENVKTQDASGHSYGTPSYVWAADYSTCTATRICLHSSEHREIEVGEATPTVIQPQACVQAELTKFTAAFTNPAFTAQIQDRIQTKDALGHDFVSGTDYRSEADGHCKQCARCDQCADKQPHSGGTATATVQAICTLCGQSYGSLLPPTEPGETTEPSEEADTGLGAVTEEQADPAVDSAPSDEKPPLTDESSGPPTGAWVAILIGSVVLAGAGGFSLYWFFLRKKK